MICESRSGGAAVDGRNSSTAKQVTSEAQSGSCREYSA